MAINTIRLMDYSNKFKEFVLDGAATAGMLMERTAAGKAKVHSVADSLVNIQEMFLFEKELEGKEIDEQLLDGERVQVWYPAPGDEIYAILSDGETISQGDKLTSNGDGTLKKAVDTSTSPNTDLAPVAIALEDLDLAGTPATTGRIRVESL